MAEYTFATKTLHHLVLDNPLIKKVGFDIDCVFSRLRYTHVQAPPPVFIAGLARAGTTILLEALYSTRQFTTLTYRDMPFVTSPLIWRALTASYRHSAEKLERAHGDGLYVNFDSPEAFEEVFWMTFTGQKYVQEKWIEPQFIDEEVVENYRRFVANIIAKSEGSRSTRYLAKNNNNVLRINSLKEAFPESIIIVPFRNPFDHSRSLLAQHQQFRKIHSGDTFSLQYMNWLGHFEFGENFKPFRVSEEALPGHKDELDQLNYWLRYWKCVYEYLIQHHASDVVFFDYDEFCLDPSNCFDRLGRVLSLDPILLKPFCSQVRNDTRRGSLPVGIRTLDAQTEKVYKTLKGLSVHVNSKFEYSCADC